MKGWFDASSEASKSWVSAIINCLCPFGACFQRDPRCEDYEKNPPMIVNNQPTSPTRPVSIGELGYAAASQKPENLPRKSFGSSQTSLTGRSRFWSDGSSHRPLISAPSDFRRIQSGSYHLGTTDLHSCGTQIDSQSHGRTLDKSKTQQTFPRPLELSIYLPDHGMAPILPPFRFSKLYTPSSSPVSCAGRTEQDRQDHQLHRERSNSSMSFHLPRRQANGSPSTTRNDIAPPKIPAKSKYRARAYTVPEIDAIKERVVSALIEVEHLQRQINHVIERQSLYLNSRPSTSQSVAQTTPDLEPMPSIPALPPAAPSFAERLNAEIDKPQASPRKTVNPVSGQNSPTPEVILGSSSQTHKLCANGPLPPPLPLAFRPPLRKKKSFSRISTWLFPHQGRDRDTNLESITNHPKSLKGNNGFYQIMSLNGPQERRSFESFDSILTWHTEDENRMVLTNRSSGSTDNQPLARTLTFGNSDARLGNPSIGAAV